MVYAKNRASVTFDGKTWRMEYQPTDNGFRYADTANEWSGQRRPAALRELARQPAARLQLPADAADDVAIRYPSQNLMP